MSVPTGLTQLIAFVLFVAPGVAFEFTYALRRPGRERSALQEIAGVIVVSVLASAIVLIAGLLALPDDWFAALRATVLRPTDATQQALVGLSAAVGGSVFAAVVLAVGAAVLLTRKSSAKMFNEPVWFRLFGRRPAKTVPYVVVRLSSGDRYYGRVIAYTTGQVPQGERDIVLGPPLYARWARSHEAKALDEFGRISVSGSTIESLAVSYYPEGIL